MYESFKQTASSVRASASGVLTAEVSIYQDGIAPVADYLFNQPHSIAGATSSVLGAGAWGVGKVVQASNLSRLFNMTMATIALGSVVKQALGASGGQLWKPLEAKERATAGYKYVDSARNTWRSWTNVKFKIPGVTTALGQVWTAGRGNFKMNNLPLLAGVATGVSFIAVAATQFTNVSEGYKTLALASLAVSYFASNIRDGINWLKTPKAVAPATDAERKLNDLFDALEIPEDARAAITATQIFAAVHKRDLNKEQVTLLKGFLEIDPRGALPVGQKLEEAFTAKLEEVTTNHLVGTLKHAANALVQAALTDNQGEDLERVIKPAVTGALEAANKICGIFNYVATCDMDARRPEAVITAR